MLAKKLQAATAGEPSDPYFSNVSLLLHGDGTNGAQNNTFIDSSPNNFSITRNGNVTQGTFSPFSKEPGKWGVSFGGKAPTSYSALSVADAGPLQLESSDFTIEAWVCPDIANSDTIIAGKGTVFAAYGDWCFYDSGSVGFYARASSGWDFGSVGIGTLPIGQWSHIAVTRSGSLLRGFLNGTLIATATVSGAIASGGRPTTVGGGLTSAQDGERDVSWKGTISNFRIIKGTALYTSNFTPPTTPLTAVAGTSLLCCQDNRFKDNSANNFTLTPYGNVAVTPLSPFANSAAYSASVNGGSGYFDGSGDYLTVPSNAAFAFGTGDFTIECWMNMASTSCRGLFKLDASAGYSTGIQLLPRPDTSNTFQIFHGTSYYFTASNSLTPLNTWCHVAIVRSGGTIQLFSNGVSIYSATDTTNYSDLPVIVGYGYDSAYPMHGFIAGFRIIKGAALYTANFTPPTTPVTAVTNTSLLLNFTNAGIYDNTGLNNLETVGNAQISTSVKKYGTGALYFDGSGDWLNGGNGSEVSFGTGDFTIEFFAKTTSSPTYKGILSGVEKVGSNGLQGVFSVELSALRGFLFHGNQTYVNASDVNPDDDQWHHWAVSRSSGVIRLFKDGETLTLTTSNGSGLSFICNYGVTIGRQVGTATSSSDGNSYPFNGYIDDLRITKGVARYTANFTPPTAAFPNQ